MFISPLVAIIHWTWCSLKRSYTSNIFVSKRQQAAASRRATVEQLQSNQGNGPVCCGNAAACCPRADPGQSSCCSAFGRLGSLSCMTSRQFQPIREKQQLAAEKFVFLNILLLLCCCRRALAMLLCANFRFKALFQISEVEVSGGAMDTQDIGKFLH